MLMRKIELSGAENRSRASSCFPDLSHEAPGADWELFRLRLPLAPGLDLSLGASVRGRPAEDPPVPRDQILDHSLSLGFSIRF